MDKQDVVAFWGERCPEFCPTCTSCQAWLWFDKAGIVLGIAEATGQSAYFQEQDDNYISWTKDC